MLYAIEISVYDYVWFTLKARKVSLQVVSNCEAMAVLYNNCDVFKQGPQAALIRGTLGFLMMLYI